MPTAHVHPGPQPKSRIEESFKSAKHASQAHERFDACIHLARASGVNCTHNEHVGASGSPLHTRSSPSAPEGAACTRDDICTKAQVACNCHACRINAWDALSVCSDHLK
eukprot:6178844-Pleurochrysis_carterae.AAC.1